MLITDAMTQLATFGRVAPAHRATWVHLTAVTPIPVAPTGRGGFVKGTGVPTVPAAQALPAIASRPTAALMTDQTPAVTAGDGSLGNLVCRRPPA